MLRFRFILASVCLTLPCCTRNTDLGHVESSAGAPLQGGTGSAEIAGTSGQPGLGLGGLGGTTSEEPPTTRSLPVCADCNYPTCAAGQTTSISGTVRTPAKVAPDPLYNAVVYLPGAAIEPFAPGVSCDRCGNVSGKPVAATLSGSDGGFKLEDAPAGHDIRLVVQMGRWRRQVTIPEIVACQDNPLPEDLTRFPRNRAEGDIPRIALVTSVYDPEECILRKIGIEDAEFTDPSTEGRVNLFTGEGALGGPSAPSGYELWSDPKTLARYDMVLLPCNSRPEYLFSGDEEDTAVSLAARGSLADYANSGGRVFATDLSYSWITGDGSPYQTTATWVDDPEYGDGSDTLDTSIDTNFPKGQALADWLNGVGATPTAGQLTLHDTYRRSLSVNVPTQRWLYSAEPESLQSFTFNTPLDAAADQQCGRVAYSSFHIAGAPDLSSEPTFPEECDDAPLTPQERVLEFMLFDLASCVQIDTGKPKPPVIVK